MTRHQRTHHRCRVTLPGSTKLEEHRIAVFDPAPLVIGMDDTAAQPHRYDRLHTHEFTAARQKAFCADGRYVVVGHPGADGRCCGFDALPRYAGAVPQAINFGR